MLDLINAHAPLISLLTPVLLFAAVAWRSRWFVRREQYDTDREEIAARLDVLAAEQERQAREIRRKPDAGTVSELVDAVRKLESTVAVQGEKISSMQDSVNRIDRQIHRITDKLMAGRA